MPLQFTTSPNAPVSLLTEWTIANADQLAEVIAWLYVQKRSHAARVIQALEPGAATLPGAVIANAIDDLEVKTGDIAADLVSTDASVAEKAKDKLDARLIQRDGLLFQHVSWVAAHLALPNTHAAPPHARRADKGFDGVIVD